MPEIIFNDELWSSGQLYNCFPNGNSLSASGKTLYISSSIDSLENGTVWDRLSIEADGPVKLSYYASDYKTAYINNELININEVIESETMEREFKSAVLDGLWAGRAHAPHDMPLYKARGRYFWFMLETEDFCMVKTLKIWFGLESWTEYLPEFFRSPKNGFDFLNRLLAMFQVLYMDLDKEISNISRLLEVGSTSPGFLAWISEWVGVDTPSSWQEERLRELVKNAFYLSKIKGTRECLLRAVELYTGEKPIIVEAYEAMPYGCGELYGGDIYSFTVIVGGEDVENEASILGLKRIISYYKPVYANARIVSLKPFIVLGLHTYLGINTSLSRREALVINEKAAEFGIIT